MLVTAMLLGAMPVIMPKVVEAANPPAPALWISPDESFTNAPVGTTFTMTLYGEARNGTFLYSCNMTFNPTLLNVVSCVETNHSGLESLWFSYNSSQGWFTATSFANARHIDNVGGSVSVGESLVIQSNYPLPDVYEYLPENYAESICTIVFKIIKAPSPGSTLSCQISTGPRPDGTSYVEDIDGTDYGDIYWGNATYTNVGPPAPTPEPPVALFDYSPKPVIVGQLVTFNGSASYDPDGTVAGWGWDFGDGGTGSGSIVTHTYSSTGNYVVNLTVTDGERSDEFHDEAVHGLRVSTSESLR